jgi:hypothetical protein
VNNSWCIESLLTAVGRRVEAHDDVARIVDLIAPCEVADPLFLFP